MYFGLLNDCVEFEVDEVEYGYLLCCVENCVVGDFLEGEKLVYDVFFLCCLCVLVSVVLIFVSFLFEMGWFLSVCRIKLFGDLLKVCWSRLLMRWVCVLCCEICVL